MMMAAQAAVTVTVDLRHCCKDHLVTTRLMIAKNGHAWLEFVDLANKCLCPTVRVWGGHHLEGCAIMIS